MAFAGVSIGRFRRRLEPFLSVLDRGVREVHRGLLRAVLVGLLRTPGPYVSEIARGLEGEDFGDSLMARHRRLLRFLDSPKLNFESLKAGHRCMVAGALPPHGRVYLFADLSDLGKPHAREMQGLDWVRDGSDPDKRIVRGYWLNEVYVEFEHGRVAPVVFELYSLTSGETLSQTNVILRGIDEAFRVTGPRGIWVGDRGFDDGNLFEALLYHHRDFIIRLQVGSSSRYLLLANGESHRVSPLLKALTLPEMLYDDLQLRKMGQLGWVKVRLPEHPDRVLTMVVAHMRGHPEPMALLTTQPVSDARVARSIVAAYLRRWNAAEDTVRFIKQDFRMEKFLVATLRTMQVWVFLMGVAMTLLALLLDPSSIGKTLARTVESFSDEVLSLYYRIARAVADYLQSLPRPQYRTLLRASGP